jgi:hypothetical protein
MVIEVDLRAAPLIVRLAEPDDFKAFKIVARGPTADREQFASAVARLGRLGEGGTAFIDVNALQALAGDRARRREWLASLDGMLAYARAHGWTDESGAIQAHVAWTA